MQVILESLFQNRVGERVRNDRDDRNETAMKQGILVFHMLSLLALPFCEFTVGCDLAVVKSV